MGAICGSSSSSIFCQVTRVEHKHKESRDFEIFRYDDDELWATMDDRQAKGKNYPWNYDSSDNHKIVTAVLKF